MTNNLKQVAVIDDIVGFGKCSLAITIPTLNAASIEVCAAPSAVFSTHTPIKGYSKLETTATLADTINAWRKLKLKFDAVWSASLSNEEQAYLALQLFADNQNSIKIVDPVLGDFGTFYDKDFERLLPHIKKLICAADIITPNITEAQLLTDTDSKDAETLLEALKNMGVKAVVLKGFVKGNTITNFLMDKNGHVTAHSAKFYDAIIHGAGDFFNASALAHYFKNNNLPESIDFATQITSDVVKLTIGQENFENKGICFEPYLGKISNL